METMFIDMNTDSQRPMKPPNITKLSAFISLCLISISCIGQTQTEMNQQSCETYAQADKELNPLYNQIMEEYKADPVFISKFRNSQSAWLTYRDSHLEAIFPEDDKQAFYGSVYPSCRCEHLSNLTRERNEQLKLWTKGIAEGEVCAGSRKFSR